MFNWERTREKGMIRYILSVVFFIALPLALFFATFTFFPFTVSNPLERIPNPAKFFGVWAVLGLIYGYSKWQIMEKKTARDSVL